ncbi:MAG: sugar ABC transporter permease [Chloroflexi bacterium]|nr:sugar ABC transporter permease [Chloroflexota bacterium]
MLLERLIQIPVVVTTILLLVVGYLVVIERLLNRLPHHRQAKLRPWLWLTPALIFLSVFLLYPMLNTIYLSLLDAKSELFVGFENFTDIVSDATTRNALSNTLIWLVWFTSIVVLLGLLMTVLSEKVAYEHLIKMIMFLPMAISFVAAGVIWKFMFDYQPATRPQTGTLNAIWTSLIPNGEPQPWLINPLTNTPVLIFVAIWIFAGFCMVILSAGLKGIPSEIQESARIDGANEWQSFIYITLPLLSPTIAVVATTMLINALKAFDIVYVLTNGNYNTDVIATRMYKELFTAHDFGRASAIAVVLLLATLPIIAFNIRQYRQREANL